MTDLDPPAAVMAGATAAPPPWREGSPRRGGDQMFRVTLLMGSQEGAPDPDACAAHGLQITRSPVVFTSVPEGSSLFSDSDAIVVALDAQDPAQIEAFDRLVVLSAGEVPVIAAVAGLTVPLTRRLLRGGATDALPLPFSSDDLRQALQPARRPAPPVLDRAPAVPVRQGRAIALASALGGMGTTAIATQLGVLWSKTKRVCLIDFDVQYGNAALYLDLRPSLTLGELIQDSERLDADLLDSVIVRHASGLGVVASPIDMVPLDIVTVEFVDRLVRLAQQTHDVVLLDLPNAWTDWSVRLMERADVRLLITDLSVPGIHQARRQAQFIEANGLGDRFRIVANRVETRLFGGRVDVKETEAVLGRKIAHLIANDYPTMSSAADEGRTVEDVKSGSRIVKDLKALAADLESIEVAEGLLKS